MAGNPFGIDGGMMARELGFEGLLWNSMGAVADRDFVLETLQWGGQLPHAVHQPLGRGPDQLLVRRVRLRPAGGRLLDRVLPHDAEEKPGQRRGRPSRAWPRRTTRTCKSRSSPCWTHVKTVGDSIQIAEGVLSTLAAQPDKMRAALDPFMLANDVADYLVRKGVSFRETHRISGRCDVLSEQTGTPMNELTYEQMKGVDARFEGDIAETFDFEKSVEMSAAKGGTSKACVLEQVKVLTGMIA